MVLEFFELALRFIIMAEFGFLAVAGLAATVQCVAIDVQIRKLASQQMDMIKGFRDQLETQLAEKEAKRQARLAAMGLGGI